ncbi:MAG: YbhB/YbcL family Raf kinase inhibitor-like protein [Paraburkholderia sp.]|nr:YbhB/YbcL family Raf kinase inhibitor-like protein [Paraburkholderia sp.]
MIRTSTHRAAQHLLLCASVCVSLALNATAALAAAPDAFQLTSPGLADGATLDSRHAADTQNCGGKNISPALEWHNVPAGTKSFAVTIYDPDGAKGLGVVHWLLYGIPPSTISLNEGAIPAGSILGTNVTGHTDYHGPCPPVGDIAHHYLVQVYALDLTPDALPAGLTRDAVQGALKGHVLAAASIVLRYGR